MDTPHVITPLYTSVFMYRDTEQHWNYRPETYVKLPVCVKSLGWFFNNILSLSNLAGGKI